MLESILQIFISEQKATDVLSNGVIAFIFAFLFITFVITCLIHVTLFAKLRKLRNHLKDTNRMDIIPLLEFKEEFDYRQQEDGVKVETFVQEKFSSWRVFSMPVVNLIKLVQMTVAVFILIGVLGTFIGLTMSLGSIDVGGEQLVDDIVSVLSGIDIAFYTSIAGMGLSLLMTVLIKILNTEYMLTDIMLKVESNLDETEQNNMGRLIAVSEMINNSILKLQKTNQKSLSGIENSFKGFQDYTIGLQRSAEDLAKFNNGLTKNLIDFNRLFDSMKKATVGFEASTSKLNHNFEQLFAYFKGMDGRNERMGTTFENTYRKIAEVSTTQMNTLNQFEDSVIELKGFTSSLLTEQQTIKGSYEKMNSKSYDMVKKLDEHNRDFKRIFGDDLVGKLAGITSYLSELTKEFDQFGDSIVQLPDALKTINQTQAEYKHLLGDRFDELKQFNKEFSHHLNAHKAESDSFEQHLNKATQSYEQVGFKNNQLISDINATITQMNQSFNQRENQLEMNVGILKDTLAKYVANLEGTLGDKLDKVSRNIGNAVDVTNEGVKKEFIQLRTLTEEIQQNSTRYTQQTLRELHQEIRKLNKHLAIKNDLDIGLNQDD